MPPRAPCELIVRGVELVRQLVEEERQRKSASSVRWRRDDVRFKTMPGEAAGRRDDVRYSFAMPDEAVRWSVPSPPVPVQKLPPDLHAATLTFSARLLKYVNERYDGKAPVVYKRAGIDRKLYSKIVSDNNAQVSKQTALQLAIGLQLKRGELDEFLLAAGYALSPTVPLDRAFAYCLENGIVNIFDVNRIVVEAGLPDLRIKY